jgi:integrase
VGGSLVNFGLYLLKKGNRESSVERKLKFLKALKDCSSVEEMYQRILESNWCDKSKDLALETVYQFSEFLGKPVEKPVFRAYRNQEAYVPNPEMVRRLVDRIRSLEVKAQVLIAIECGASASEVHNITWKDINLQERKITIRGVKGHQTWCYPISQELTHVLSLLPKKSGRIWRVKDSVNLGRNIC